MYIAIGMYLIMYFYNQLYHVDLMSHEALPEDVQREMTSELVETILTGCDTQVHVVLEVFIN